MADLTAMRQGLAANLSTLTDIQIVPYMQANPSPPTIQLYPAEVVYDLAMNRGLDQWTFTVQAFVGTTTDRGAQVLLDTFLDGLKAAVESDQTLGGVASSVHATTCSGYRIYTRDGAAPVLGAEWTVDVLATGT